MALDHFIESRNIPLSNKPPIDASATYALGGPGGATILSVSSATWQVAHSPEYER